MSSSETVNNAPLFEISITVEDLIGFAQRLESVPREIIKIKLKYLIVCVIFTHIITKEQGIYA